VNACNTLDGGSRSCRRARTRKRFRAAGPGLATQDDASALAQSIVQGSFVGFGIQCAGASELCGWKRIPGGTNGRRGRSHRRAPPKPVK
jgi:hypothetical protein